MQKKSDPQIWRDYLRELPRLTGKRSLTAIANDLGLPPSTLTRPIKPDDAGVSLPHQSTVNKIVEKYGIAPPAFAANAARAFPLRELAEDAQPYHDGDNKALDTAVRALTDSRPNADPWVIKNRSLELAGYLPGDVVIVDLSQLPLPGDAVCAQTDASYMRGSATTVMRLYERAGASNILMAATLDPSLRSPIAIDERVSVMGVIVGMVRPVKTAA